ncbi:N-acetyltransferase [Sphingomonas gilva]|uniref:N-acetyltransferase n=1 Tax=Sphingomonas gilva TaxID=2305907 RepID=A0A396RU43_9SPHN|nr:N-acetyltransferase [Sphingomonas gilva]RHW17913.1 N-acetyltransferase [Sphingomonas gilva]
MTLAALTLAPLAAVTPDAIEALLDRAFGADRHGRTAYRLREGAMAIPALSFAAFDGGALAGTLQCWPVALDGEPMVMVGPVAVEPARQNTGVGRAMMWAMLASAETDPFGDVLMMVGDPDYYHQFGFDASGTAGWRLPGPWEPHRLLARMTGDRARGLSGMLAPR